MEAIQDDVKEIIAEARRDAERTKADIVAAAARESEVLKERALLEISRAKDQALNELFQQMAQQVAGATQHVLGKGLTLADQQKLIDEALREFASQSA
jgi:F-type H+-transporting ATPase subunit b